ncbi:MAG: glycosyltransferase [Verrucomicrobiaceae bacterium]
MLILGQTPPPWHGQAVATQMLFEHDWPGMEVITLRMAYSEEMDRVGRFGFGKIKHLFYLIRETKKILKENPRTTLFYPPGSASWIPFIRDVIYLLAVRKFAAATVFIHHAGGLAAFVSRSPLRRYLGRLAYGRPDLAFEVAHEEIPPRDAFQASSWMWCPCAMEVPLVERSIPEKGRALNVLFVGSLQEGKGVLEVIKTAQWLKKQGAALEFRFNVVGRWFSDQFREEAHDLVKALDVGDMVFFPGEVTGDEKWKTYRDADVFFFPSHYGSEASPIVLMEAVGSGLPVVTTSWRGIPMLLEGCKSAALHPVHRPELYGQSLLELNAKRENFPEFSGEARSFYEARYQPHHFLGRIEDGLWRMWAGDRGSYDPPKANIRHSEGDREVRVLQVFNQYADQGGEEVWVDQMSKLGNDRFQIYELRFQSRSWRVRGAPPLWQQAQLMWNNPEARKRLRREIEELRPDVLVFHNIFPVGSFSLYEEAIRSGVPVLQYVHNFRPFSPSGTLWSGGKIRENALKGNRWREVLGRAWEGSFLKTGLMAYYLDRLDRRGWLDSLSHWVAVSDFMREKFIEAGIPADKISTLRHCWGVEDEDGVLEDGDYYLFLGRMVPEKGIWDLLDAWKILEDRLGESCPKLVLAGTGAEGREVGAAVAQRKKVEAVGFVSGEAKRRLLRGCRGVLAPSLWWEPLGLIVYDAFEHEKPVLAARSGGLVETVQEGDGGFLFEPGNVDELCSRVMELEELGPRGRQKMGRMGRDWLKSKASPEEWQKGFLEIMKKAGVEVSDRVQ